MKRTLSCPGAAFALLLLAGCGGGNPTATLTAPSAKAVTVTPTTPSAQPTPPTPSAGFEIAFTVVTGAVNQPTTFIVAASASLDAVLDFGDGTMVSFSVNPGANAIETHTYAQSGTFAAVLTVTSTVDSTTSRVPISIFVR